MQSLWMVVAALMFSAMSVCVKLASTTFSAPEILFYRGLVGTAATALLLGARQPSLLHALATRRIGMHLSRSISGTIAITMWFFAISGLPIATATTLNYASPLFMGAALTAAALWAGRRPDSRMLLAIAAGFAGVVVLLQPTLSREQWPYAAVGLASAAVSAVAYLSVRALTEAGEPEGRIVFYFSAMNVVAGFLGALAIGFHVPGKEGALLLGGVGVSATLAQLALTRAYGSGRMLLTANLSFTGILFATIWGVTLFGDHISGLGVAGMALIVASGVLATITSVRTPQPTHR